MGYISLLNKILVKYHGTHPVHSADELRRLADKFPNNIKLYIAEKNGQSEAGTVLFCRLAWYIHNIWPIRTKVGKAAPCTVCWIGWLQMFIKIKPGLILAYPVSKKGVI